jgi:hypothetical protein
MLNLYYSLFMCLALSAALVVPVFVPAPASDVYLLEGALLGAWLVSDAVERQAKSVDAVMWGLAAVVLSPIVIPRWYAQRPLKAGECRKGGWDCNFFNAFGAITLMFAGVSAALNHLTFGYSSSFELIANTGLATAGMAFVLALFARDEKVCEQGRLAAESIRKDTAERN